MNLVTVVHRTTYRYATDVDFGDHEMMLRPLPGRDLRILDSRLWVSPDARLSSRCDAYGNVVQTARLLGKASELSIVSAFRVLHRPRSREALSAVSLACARMPPGPSEAASVAVASPPRREDPQGRLSNWATQTVAGIPNAFDALSAMCFRINAEFRYARRDTMGTQDPLRTLELGTGSCRDFAFLMVEAARSLGHAARFTSGYLYDEDAPAGGADELVGGMSTHAWAQVHLPGAGWVDFDPTNDLVGGRNLIPSSVVMQPSEASPVSGSYHGLQADYLGMDVDVAVRSRPARSRPSRDAAREFVEDALPGFRR